MKLSRLVTLLLLTCCVARAQESASSSPAQSASCSPLEEDCICERNWGCWELLYTTKGTILGVRTTLTYVEAETGEPQAGFVTVYATERYATRNTLSVHFAASGSIGGGTAGNEGSLALALDVGYRGVVKETSGPFLRAGMGGMLVGHRTLLLSMFEPMQGRVGYQVLDGDNLLEFGSTYGMIPVGAYHPGADGKRSLSRSKELGGYLAFHRPYYRFSAGFMQLFTSEERASRDLQVGRASLCDYHLMVTVCADALAIRGQARFGERTRMAHSLYMGITVGLSP